MSDIVFVQIFLFVCVDSLHYGYFNPLSWVWRRFNWAQVPEKGKTPEGELPSHFIEGGLPFKAITLPSSLLLNKSTLHYFLWEILLQFSNKLLDEHNFGINYVWQARFHCILNFECFYKGLYNENMIGDYIWGLIHESDLY